MKIRLFLLLALVCVLLFSCVQTQQRIASEKNADLPEFNKIVLNIIKQYPTDGTHGYWWPQGGEGNYDGCTQDLSLNGKTVMKGEPQKRAYCCGLTLEVFLRSYKKWLETHGGEKASVISGDDWPRFQKLWFVEKVNGPGPSAAVEAFGLGRTIEPDQALPGDFVQIWRTLKEGKKTPSGHSVIFLSWIKDSAGKIDGMRYWSTQPGTNGISERVEYFGANGGIAGENSHFTRVEPKAKTGGTTHH